MALFDVSKTTNPDYKIHLSCPGHNLEIVTDMPEELTIGVTSEWESRLPFTLSSILETALGNIGESLVKIWGENRILQEYSYQMWMGTSPIEIPLTFLFDAVTDAERDVYRPVQGLMGLVLPVNDGTILKPPGPIRGGDNYGVTIRIGRMMMFQDCIMQSANQTLDTRLDAKGFPIAAQVECTFQTNIVYGHQDWMRAMGFEVSSSETLLDRIGF